MEEITVITTVVCSRKFVRINRSRSAPIVYWYYDGFVIRKMQFDSASGH